MTALPAIVSIPLTVLWACIGLAVGSFLSVVVSRLPAGAGLGGRSRCPACGTTLGPRELIPVVSYFLQKRRCRTCGRHISWIYPTLEIAAALLFVLALAEAQFVPLAVVALSGALAALLGIAVIDADTKTIPDSLNGTFVFLSLAYAVETQSFSSVTLLAAVAFFGLQWLISRGTWVGSGDIILAAGIALLVGSWQGLLAALLASYIIGGAAAAVLLSGGHVERKAQIPFAPFLALGAVVALLLPL